jgi:amino acid adenylation domain-containing protein
MNGDNIEDIYELSPAQQGILFHSLYSPDSGVYFVQQCYALRGNLNIVAFEDAWQQVVTRHTALRTSFYWENLDKPVQVVNRQVKVPLEQYDWRGIEPTLQQEQLEAFLESDRKQGFDMSQESLIRLTLIGLSDDSYQFIWSKHHLILDGWSTALVLKDVVQRYEVLCQGQKVPDTPSRPYGDYIAWLQQQDLSKAETFWRQALSGIQAPTPLISPNIDKPHPVEYDEQQVKLSQTTTAALQSLARQHQLTLNTLVQGAWAILLSRYSREDDVIYGSTVSGRPADLTGAESMVGLFINTLPVRVKVDANTALLPWLKQLQAQLVEMRQYEYSPLIEIQGWSEVPRGVPLFESILVFENYPVDRVLRESKVNIEIQNVSAFDRTNYPLTAIAIPGSELEFKISYDRNRFDYATITRMLGHFQTLLEAMVTNPDVLLKDLPLLTKAEEHQLLVEWNDTQAESSHQKCIHQLFEEQVERTPDAVAVVFEDEQLTYQELNQRANQIAHYLRKLGVEPEVLVGICIDRSPLMLVGLLGILKAGGAYVPLDPAYPKERLAFMVSDSQMPLVLIQQSLLEILPEHQAQAICLDTDWSIISQQSQQNPDSRVTSSQLAYVIYTSGSTGKPKGVQILHGGVVNFLSSMQRQLGVTQSDILVAVTSISFDIAGLELYLPLMTGARLVLVSRAVATDGMQLSQLLDSAGATLMQATPATWQMLLAAGWQGSTRLKILCGGEALSCELAFQLLEKGAALWNLYGPTETTIWSTAYRVEVTELSTSTIPIGRPIANTQIYLLNSQGQPVPIGIPGELHIGGAGLARGYLNRPNLTTEKFISHPVGERLYKTGDLARYRADGTIEYIGRLDHQVKLRGFRIELGEIEAMLSQHPQVRETVVIVTEDEPGNKRLVAYIVGETSSADITDKLRSFLEEKLPNYMVPSVFVMLEALPLTPNGKIDRRTLPAPDRTKLEREDTFVSPMTKAEKILAEIWTRVLGVENIGIHDNFFELGGDSLISIQIIYQANQAGLQLTPKQLFDNQTIAKLAALADPVQTIETEQELETEQEFLIPEQQSPQAKGYTASDFPQAQLAQKDIDKLMAKVNQGSEKN